MTLQQVEELSKSKSALEAMKILEKGIEFNICKISKANIAYKNKDKSKTYIKNIY